jgi:hypothetical protein
VPSSPALFAERVTTRPGRSALVLKVALGVAVVCAGLVLWMELWPFEQKPVVQELQEAGDSTVRVRAFHRTYFPSPGCVIEGLEFYHGANQ